MRRHPAIRPPAVAARHPRAGLSLLEVLVAGGILVIGLASVAALLPAAGSRLSQASQEDRAGIMAANARAEIANRGLAAEAVFTGTDKACVLASGSDSAKTLSLLPTLSVAGTLFALASGTFDARMFVLEDELVYRPTTTAATPLNTFEISGTAGPREYRPGIFWNATLVPATYPADAGDRATLSIAVFAKSGTCQELTLTGTSGAARIGTGTSNGLADEDTRKRFLAGCTHVLALTNPPQWRRIQASWTMPGPMTSGSENTAARASYIVLDPPLTSGSLTVVGFEHLIRVEQHGVTLE